RRHTRFSRDWSSDVCSSDLLRAMQVWQSKNQAQIVYQNSQVWRNIWSDGRELPREILEPRWYGYSVGKWIDDYTFVVETIGLDRSEERSVGKECSIRWVRAD